MAPKNIQAPATPPAPAPKAPPASAASVAKADKDPRYVAVTMYPELLAALRKAAKEAGDQSLGGYISSVLAEKLNVAARPAKAKRVKYASAEAKKAAMTQRRKDHAAEVKEALELLRKMRQEQAAKAA